jgi:hypothetical protein
LPTCCNAKVGSLGPQRDENRGKSAILKRTFRGPGTKKLRLHEVADDNQQQRMPAVAYRYTFDGGVAGAF